jgi:hypothetical protein
VGFAARLGKNFSHPNLDRCTILFMTNRTYKTGPCREQLSLLPARVEDYVARDNPVRAIEAYVCALDLESSGSGIPVVVAERGSQATIRRTC